MQNPLTTNYTELTKEAEEFVEEVFTYHKPDHAQEVAFKLVRDAFVAAAKVVLLNVPACADRSVTIRKLREARMDANAAIALRGMI